MKKTLLFVSLLFAGYVANAQLNTGDIAFVGFNSDGGDGLAFVNFVDIPANTKIYFRDDEWDGTKFNTGESFINWKSGTAVIPAGTIIELSSIVLGAGNANFGTLLVSGSNAGISNSNEAIFAYLGTDSLNPTTFLTAIANGPSSSSFTTLAGTGLVEGISAFVFATGTPDIGAFNGSRVGTFANAKLAIYNQANWITQDATGDQSADGTLPDVPFDKTPFTSVTTGDKIPPTVTKATYIDNRTISIVFSEKMKLATISNSNNFTGIGIISDFLFKTAKSGADSIGIKLEIPLQLGKSYTLTINNVQDTSGNTITLPFKYAFSIDSRMEVFTLKKSPVLGTSQGINIFLGGNSGLSYIQGTNREFYAVTDRGANADDKTGKLFVLPDFNPQIIRYKAEGDSLKIMQTIGLKRPNGSLTTGMINPISAGGTGEVAFIDLQDNLGTPDVWGIDSEGIVEDKNGNFYISEEYGTSVWHVNADGKVINRFAPFSIKQPQDLSLDTVFKYRNPNKGLEGVAYTPSGKVYSFIQGPLYFPASDVSNIKKSCQLHRIVEIDPATNTTKMFGYEHDTPAASTVGNDKNYIGDASAINNNEFLILEHGKGTLFHSKLYKISIANATPITQATYSGKTFEQLNDAAGASAAGIQVVTKTLFLDLTASGYGEYDKPEGLAILNDSTVAIANDNDFGIVSPNADGKIEATGVKSTVFIFTVPQSKKLTNYVPVLPIITSTEENINVNQEFTIFPNPVQGGEIRFNYEASGQILNEYGSTVVTFGKYLKVDIHNLKKGFYILQTKEGYTGKLIVE